MFLNILFILVFIFSLVFLFMLWSKRWPSVLGDLIEVNQSAITINGRTGYRINVIYQFHANQKKYISNNMVLLGDKLQKSQKEADYIINNLKSKPLMVFYCPIYPPVSYIKSNPKHIPIIFGSLIITLVMTVFMYVNH